MNDTVSKLYLCDLLVNLKSENNMICEKRLLNQALVLPIKKD